MIISRKTLIRELLALAGFGAASATQTYLLCSSCTNTDTFILVFFFTLSMWVSLWRGNSLLSAFVSARISWIEFPEKRFFVGLASTVLYTAAAVSLVIWLFSFAFGLHLGDGFNFTIYFSVILTLIFSIVVHTVRFFKHWRSTAVETQRLRRESAAARYDKLKSTVNPDFLLEALSHIKNLARTDKDRAVSMIKSLSGVYRHMLDTRNQELVEVRRELQSVKQYSGLLALRSGSHLKVDVPDDPGAGYIVPLAVQLTIEGAVSSLLSDQSHELSAVIDIGQDHLEVCLVAPGISGADLSKFSPVIDSISARYACFSDRAVNVSQGSQGVIVSFPVLSSDLWQ